MIFGIGFFLIGVIKLWGLFVVERFGVFVVSFKFVFYEIVVVLLFEELVLFKDFGVFVVVLLLCWNCLILDCCNLIVLLDNRYKKIVVLDCFIKRLCNVFLGFGIFLLIIYFCILIGKLNLLNI